VKLVLLKISSLTSHVRYSDQRYNKVSESSAPIDRSVEDLIFQ